MPTRHISACAALLLLFSATLPATVTNITSGGPRYDTIVAALAGA
jgi:hypothetical protein